MPVATTGSMDSSTNVADNFDNRTTSISIGVGGGAFFGEDSRTAAGVVGVAAASGLRINCDKFSTPSFPVMSCTAGSRSAISPILTLVGETSTAILRNPNAVQPRNSFPDTRSATCSLLIPTWPT